MVKLGLAVALLAACVVLLVPQAGSSHGSAVVQTTDIMLAFDATDSMGPSIGLAQREGKSLITAVGNLAPGTRFAVASFRDRYSPSGEYTLLTGMTADRTRSSVPSES